MAELTNQERLQPSLLDRLLDNAPDERVESREQRVLSFRLLRQSVMRDLAWLLNTSAYETLSNLDEYPFVLNSVINYGSPVLAGTSVSSMDLIKFENKIKQAIINFEPRIIAATLKVNLISDEKKMNAKAVSFKIEGELWAQPLPIQLYIRSDLDLETGEVTVKDLGG